MNVKRLALAAVLALTLAAPAPALAWGNAPTHFSIGYKLVTTGAVPISSGNYQAFGRAAAAPDLAWTPLFKTMGLTYVHSPEFAGSLLYVAKKSQNGKWLAMAFAWGAHLAADAEGHHSDTNANGYIPEAEPMHSLVEVAVDTVVFYPDSDPDYAPPSGYSSWAEVNVSFDANLLYQASIHYYRNVKRVPLVWPWVASQALNGLKNSINAEYSYIKLKKDSSLSQAFLNDLADNHILPSAEFVTYYDKSVDAAAAWIAAH
jgi:hypothetical protein